jgi:hypothetical protein
MVMESVNTHEATARAVKALKLYRALEEHDLTQDAKLMQREHWRMLAQAAGVNPPSERTTAMVLQLCEEF